MDKSGSRRGNRKAWEEHIARIQTMTFPKAEHATAQHFFGNGPVTKYGNRATWVEGRRFASRLEADRYRELLLERAAGNVAWFIRQVPFDVAVGVVYRADFLVVWNPTGTLGVHVSIEDTKGHLTATSRAKIAVVEERYPIKVRILRRADVRRFT